MAEQATQKAEEKPIAAMGEAGFSMNVKMIDKFGQEVQLTFRAPQVNLAQKLLGYYEDVVKHLLNGGWQVSKVGARPATNGAPVENGAPVCRVHNVSMKPSKHGGGHYCPKKEDNGNWCKEKG